MKRLPICLVLLLLGFDVAFGFMFNGPEPIEQKYESPTDSEVTEHSSDAGATSSLDAGQNYGQQQEGNRNFDDLGGAGSYKSSMFSGGEEEPSSGYKSPSENLRSNEEQVQEDPSYGSLKSITSIPSGSMFAFDPANPGKGPLEFESPYSKQPYSIVFRTQSMPVKIKQQHQTLPAPEVEYVRSQEEPHRVQHTVTRPIIQEVVEIIQPYRRVVQEIKPVIENIHTIVAKDSRGAQGGGGGKQGGEGQQFRRGGEGQQYGRGGEDHGQQAQAYGEARGYQQQQQQQPERMYRRKGVMRQAMALGQLDYPASKYSRSSLSRY